MRRTFTMADLTAKSATRPAGYDAAVMALAVEIEPGVYRLSDQAFRELRRTFTPRRERAAKMMKRWRLPGPGDAMAWCIKLATFGRVKVCDRCGTWRRRFNRAGWRGWWRLLPPWAASWVKGASPR